MAISFPLLAVRPLLKHMAGPHRLKLQTSAEPKINQSNRSTIYMLVMSV